MGSFSLVHWLIVLVVVLLIFGPKKLSEVGKGLGEGMRNFKRGIRDDDDEPPAKSQPRQLEVAGQSATEATDDDKAPKGARTKPEDKDRAAG
jgi:sec-independent protein translocase protein TatA